MTSTIKIKGMSCVHCVAAVSQALGRLEGIKNVKVDLDKGQATFETETAPDMDLVKREIENAGYELG
jgi:copper chaperone